MAKLIFGCGYLGYRVAKMWRDAGENVDVVSRSRARAESLQAAGFLSIVADVTQPASLAELPDAESVLFAVGYDRSGKQSIHEVYASGVQHVLDALEPSATRFIYISTTGVYGDAEGDWVDEQTPPAPRRDGGRASLAAEQLIAAHSLGTGAVVLRLAGIYGPGRIPYLDQLRAGEPIAAPSTGWLNLIHVEDAARIVVAIAQWQPTTEGPHTFCVSDGNPVVRGEYYREVARRIGAAPPQLVAPPADSPAAARAAADKRIANTWLRSALDYEFLYPSYREGLAASLVETTG